jgi:hypothetical protein
MSATRTANAELEAADTPSFFGIWVEGTREMGSMRCRCGGLITEDGAPSPTEGAILGDEDLDSRFGETCRILLELLRADRAGTRKEWIVKSLGTKYSGDESDEDIISAILYDQLFWVSRDVYECKHCGRLLIQPEPRVNRYVSYAPDEPGYASILRARLGPAQTPDATTESD